MKFVYRRFRGDILAYRSIVCQERRGDFKQVANPPQQLQITDQGGLRPSASSGVRDEI
jgi:hypothetical protein